MAECFHCGISEDKALLSEGIYKTGIVKVCRKCKFKFDIPLIEHKEVDWRELEQKTSTVRDRLSNMAHVNVPKNSTSIASQGSSDAPLRHAVEKRIGKAVSIRRDFPEDLVDNFHWIIMKKRRALSMTHNRFAEIIGIPEELINSIEKGQLPEDYKDLIKKIENVLGPCLFKRKPLVELVKEEITEEDVSDLVVRPEEKKSFLRSSFDKILKSNLFSRSNEEEKEEVIVEDLDLEMVNDIVGEPVVEPQLEVGSPKLEVKGEEVKELKEEKKVEEEKKIEGLYLDENYHRELEADWRYMKKDVQESRVENQESQIEQSVEEKQFDDVKRKVSDWERSIAEKEFDKKISELGDVMDDMKQESADIGEISEIGKDFDDLQNTVDEMKREVVEEDLTEDDIRRISWGG